MLDARQSAQLHRLLLACSLACYACSRRSWRSSFDLRTRQHAEMFQATPLVREGRDWQPGTSDDDSRHAPVRVTHSHMRTFTAA